MSSPNSACDMESVGVLNDEGISLSSQDHEVAIGCWIKGSPTYRRPLYADEHYEDLC